MIVLAVVCRARQHDTELARAAGCVCPVDWGQPYQPAVRTSGPQREYVRGRAENRLCLKRTQAPEADWVAVERALAGDRSIALTKVERDEAIDRLDRQGLSAREVAVRLGITTRTVNRRRAERRVVAS